MEKSSTVFVGMDVHKESIDITLAEPGGEVRRLGAIGGDRGSLLKMVRRQQSKGRKLVFVYEAGPCGFWIYREITALGHACMVVSPSLESRLRHRLKDPRGPPYGYSSALLHPDRCTVALWGEKRIATAQPAGLYESVLATNGD